jgi:hypothetical protein
MFRQGFVVSSGLLAGLSAVPWADWDVQTVFCGEELPFCLSVSGPMGGLGCSDSVLWGAAAFWLVGQRSHGRIGMFRQCFVVSSCLLAGRSAVRCVDWYVQTVFCGEQLFLVGRSAVRLSDWVVQTVFCGVQLPLSGRSAVRWASWDVQSFVVSSCLLTGLSAVR